VQLGITASGNDAEERADGTIDLTSSDLEFMHDNNFSQDQKLVAMRFSAQIPRNATIHSASLQFTVDEASSGTATLLFSGEAADFAAALSSQSGDLSARAQTTAKVSWAPADWPAVGASGVAQKSPDLGAIVQEIVSRPGWAHGNTLVLFVSGTGRRVAESYDGSAGAAPVLTVHYSGGDPYCGDGTCDAGEDTANCVADCGSPGGGPFQEPVLPDPKVGGTATLGLDDGTSTHVFPPGQTFSVGVTVSGITSDVVAQWHKPGGGPISQAVIFTPPASVTVQSPSTAVGAYELKIWSPDSLVRFPPQNAGQHRWFGFAVLPVKSVSSRSVEPGSFFGMIHADDDDPYLRGGIKNVWTKQSPSDVVNQIKTRRSKGLEELPAVASDHLSWDHTKAVTTTRLEQFRSVIRPFMDELQNKGVASPDWQLGVEIDGKLDDGPYGIANYCQFARILREELDRIGATSAKIVSSFDGFDYTDDFGALILHPDSHYFDAIGTDPYAWWAPDKDFTMPDEASKYLSAPWLQKHIETLRGYMNANPSGPQEIWFTEMGLPHGGNYDVNDFFGYPSSGVETARRDRLYTANYVLRSHVIAKATGSVSRIYWYNYADKGNDIDYAEHHFGMRSYGTKHPKPIYTAYAIMAERLSGASFVEKRTVGSAVQVYDFLSPSGGHVWVVWRHPAGSETLQPSALGPVGGSSVSAFSLFGTPLDLSSGTLTLTEVPIYVVVQ
jgi:hypothetical protein